MICPFCLEDVRFKKEKQRNGSLEYVCPSTSCGQIIPRLYAEEYHRYPPIVMSIIGHRAHGKTVALSTLYYALSRLNIETHWPDFYLFPINEASIEVVFEKAQALEAGKLPPPNPKIFPEPTLLQASSLPLTKKGKATLLFYDTAGEAFLRTQDIGRYAGFVRRAHTALFLVSLPQLRRQTSKEHPAGELQRLLYAYIQGMADLGTDTRNQHLIIVYTCADAILSSLADWPDVQQYILHDDWTALQDAESYAARMYNISSQLETYTRDVLSAHQFLNLASDRFASVRFSIISALGAAPGTEGNLAVKIKPRRIFDPLLWTLERALPARKQRRIQQRARQLRLDPDSKKRSHWLSLFR